MSNSSKQESRKTGALLEGEIEGLACDADRQASGLEELLRLMMESSPDFIMLLEPDATIRYLNRALPDSSVSELVGTRIYEHLDDRQAAKVKACLEQVLESGKPNCFELERGSDGEVSIFESRIAPVTRNGQVAALIVNSSDVTEQRRTVDALAASEERHRFLTANISDAIWTLDVDRRFRYISPSIERLAGFTAVEFQTRKLEEVLSHDSYERAQHTLADELKHDGEPGVDPDRWRSMELELTCKDGSLVWTESKVRFLRDASGAPNGVIGVTRDISSWKQTQEALRSSEDRLRQAQRLEAVGQLAGGVAHDFNNLLTVIQGNHDLLMRDFYGADPRRSRLEEIGKAANKAASLTRQLLAFARRQRLEPEVLSLNDVVSETAPILERLLPEDIQIAFELDSDLAYVEADRGQLEQVLLNLVVNARDAMPRGGALRIATSNADLTTEGFDAYEPPVMPSHYVRLEVTDDGLGIPEELQAKVFEPFFTTKDVGEGTGMGLATVYGIIKQSKGYVWVESSKGQGTTFEILLPRSSRKKTEERELPAGTVVASGTETVLLVEDEDAVRDLTGNILKEFGYRVLEAASGRIAMEICATEGGRIDILVTDLVMPEMWGDELSWRLCTAFPGIRVLYLSGYGDRRKQRRSDGASNFLEKPFTAERLLEKVREVLDADPSELRGAR